MDSGTRETGFEGINANAERDHMVASFVLRLMVEREPEFVDAFTTPGQTEAPEWHQIYQDTKTLLDNLAKSFDGRIDKGDLVPSEKADPSAPAIKLGWAKYVPFTTSSPEPGSEEVHSYLRFLTDDGKRLLNEYFALFGQPTAEDAKQAQLRRARQAFTDLGFDLGFGHGVMPD